MLRPQPWPISAADAVLCINMIHIAPWEAAVGLVRGAAALLRAGCMLYLYGPFRRDGGHTAPSNAAFDRSLRVHNPAWGCAISKRWRRWPRAWVCRARRRGHARQQSVAHFHGVQRLDDFARLGANMNSVPIRSYPTRGYKSAPVRPAVNTAKITP